MPDAVFRSRHRTRRRWWLWAVGLVGVAGAAAASIWLFLIVKQQSGHPGGAAPFLAVASFVAALAQVVFAWLQLRQSNSAKPHERREGDAYDCLRAHLGRQDDLPRMDDFSALALGVQRAIDLPPQAVSSAAASPVAGSQPTGSLDRDLPTFVERDKGPEIRKWMHTARDTGGFLLLEGSSWVGKTRLLYEAAREVLGDFAVLAPDRRDGALVNKIAAATSPLPPLLIVWLDELQHFLDGPYLAPGAAPITAATVRHLLDAPTPVIIVGTLLREYAAQLRLDRSVGLKQFRYSNAADVLDRRRVDLVFLDSFCVGEREAAKRLASQDPRLAQALADREYNVTEALASAPDLVLRYKEATQEPKAILHAAIDARRLGIQGPLTEKLLAAAARGHLTTHHPDDTWFLPALNELTSDDRSGDHATDPLIRELNPDRSEVLGYTITGYLRQLLILKRHNTPVPTVTWQALIDHTDNSEDLFRLAESADSRYLNPFAELLYRRLSDAGHRDGLDQLARLLYRQGRIKEVIELLQTHAGAGDEHALDVLVDLLLYQDRIEDAYELLRARADADDRHATDLLVKQGLIDEAIELLRHRADADDGDVDIFRSYRRIGGRGVGSSRFSQFRSRCFELFRRLFKPGLTDSDADFRHATDRLDKEGRLDEGIKLLRPRAYAGDGDAADALADLLVEQGRPDEAIELLRIRADMGDEDAAHELTYLLAEQGRPDELWAEVYAGTPYAAERLIDLLSKTGDTGLADRIRQFGLNPDGSIADGDPGNHRP